MRIAQRAAFLLVAYLCLISTTPTLRAESELVHHFHLKHLHSAGQSASTAAGADADPARRGSGRNYAPSREIDVTHQTLDVTPDFDRRSVAGIIKIEFKPIALPLAELKLDAVDLTITNVQSSASILGWQNTGTQLIVTFRDPIPADTASWVRVAYSASEPEKGLYFRTPAMGYKEGDTHLWTQGEMHEARHWFPSYDYPNEKFTTEMICHVKPDMVALSNGRLVSQEPNNSSGLVAWRWLQDKPHVNYLVTLCAGYFKKLEDRHGDLPLAYWTPASQIAYASNSFAGTRKMMAFFEQETGVKYPWARYDQVVVDDFTWGGMENTAQTTLTASTLYPPEFHRTRDQTGLIAHELAHQWFGDLVTTKDWAHIWLNEGFATYYEALYDEHDNGRDEFLYNMLGKAGEVLHQPNDIIPIVNRTYKDPVEQFGFRAYPKGAWVLHMLRSQLGTELYRRCVTTYLQRHAYGTVATDDFADIIEELSGRDWGQFFDQYVFHAHHPELKVSYSWDERSKLAKISIQQTQKLGPTVLLFKLPLKIRFKSATTTTDAVAHVADATEDFYFALPAKPDVVRVDPDFGWLAQIDFPLPTDMLFAQLDNRQDVIGRVLAIRQLEKKPEKPVIAKLQAALNQDPFWGVRLEAAFALRQIHNDDARAALLASTNQPDDRVRRQVTHGLSAFLHAETPALLTRLSQGEKNPDLVADAFRALAPYATSQVKETLLTALRSSSYQQVIANAALDAMRSQRDPAYIEPLLDVLAQREAEFTSNGLENALRTLATLAADQDNKDAVRAFLVDRVNHPKRRVQVAVIRALGTLGDPKAIAVLETFTEAGDQTARHQAARASIRQIRERKSQPAEIGTLHEEVLQLQRQTKDLKTELETLRKKLEAAQPTPPQPAKAPTAGKKRGTARN